MRRVTTCLLGGALALSLTSLAPGGQAEPDNRPNIVFIFSDDHGWQAIGSYGSRINETPNIDRIAREGARLNTALCVNAISAPSRATLLTGQYGHINGVRTLWDRHRGQVVEFDGSQPHVAKHLGESGYQTALVGKWHLHSDPTGFDYWNVLIGPWGQGRYFDPEFSRMGEEYVHPGYVTDIITDDALGWLEERDRDRPFMVMINHKAPHAVCEPDELHAHLFEDVTIPEPETFNYDHETRSRASFESAQWLTDLQEYTSQAPPGLDEQELKKFVYQEYLKDYLRVVASMDMNIGRVLDYLDEEGLTENTVVIYSSDQGMFLGDYGWFNKQFSYDFPLKMPFVIRHPAEIEPGTVIDDMVVNIDYAPLLMDYAGLDVPGEMQGRSFRPILAGNTVEGWRDSMYFQHYGEFVEPHWGVRTNTHKLIYYYSPEYGEYELYDLVADPLELTNLYGEPGMEEITGALKDEIARLQERHGYTEELKAMTFEEWDMVLAWKRDAEEERKAREREASAAVPGTFTLSQGDVLPAPRAPRLPNATIDISARVTVGEDGNGVIVAQGGQQHGFSLYLSDGYPSFAVTRWGRKITLTASERLTPGTNSDIRVILDEEGRCGLYVDQTLATDRVVIGFFEEQPHDGLEVGIDEGSLVGQYPEAFRFTGQIESVHLVIE